MWFATERLESLTSLARVSLPRVFWIFLKGILGLAALVPILL